MDVDGSRNADGLRNIDDLRNVDGLRNVDDFQGRAFLLILSTEGRGVRLSWEHSKYKDIACKLGV